MADTIVELDDDEFYYSAEERRRLEQEPRIVEASYHAESGFEFLNLKLSDGRRVLIPREELDELKQATTEQAMELQILPAGKAVWWPQIDDGLYLPDFLKQRWGKLTHGVAA